MHSDRNFKKCVSDGNSTGEIIGVDRYLITIKGLNGSAANAPVLFESGGRGVVRKIIGDTVLVMNLTTENAKIGELAVLENTMLTTRVGVGLVGRVINPLGEPLDGKGPIRFDDQWPIYASAPGITDRTILKDQLSSGVTVVDSLFPIVLGQRIAILGDTKSGKSSFLMQLGVNQKGTDRIVVYVLIGKRRIEIDQTIATLTKTGAIANSIVIVASIFDSLTQSYLAPYIGCAIAEYLWHNEDKDVVIIYDDLSSHAKIYREVALLANTNPGRDSYPGDMFFAHASLLERAGKLNKNNKTLTALPVVITPGDDITAFLPTSIMSITDGQIIFDLSTFRQNIRPAVNTGLSVSRVGGRAQSQRQKILSGTIFKKLAEYRQATEFARFGPDLAPETKIALQLGHLIIEAFRQNSVEHFSLTEQQLVLETVLASAGVHQMNMDRLKELAKKAAHDVHTDDAIDSIVQQLLSESTIGAE